MRSQRKLPRCFAGHLDDHTLRVETSVTNEMVYPPAKKYPKNCWMTVIATSHMLSKRLNERIEEVEQVFQEAIQYYSQTISGSMLDGLFPQ